MKCKKETDQMPLGRCCYKTSIDEDCLTCQWLGYDEELPDDIKKQVARAFDMEEGKTVLVHLDDTHAIRTDYRCMDKDTDVCDECRLRFKCHTSQYMIIDKKELNLEDIGQTINEKVEQYIERHKPPKKKPDSEMPSCEQEGTCPRDCNS